MGTKTWSFYNIIGTQILAKEATYDEAREILIRHAPAQLNSSLNETVESLARIQQEEAEAEARGDQEAVNEAQTLQDHLREHIVSTVYRRIEYAVAEDGERIEAEFFPGTVNEESAT